LVKFINFSIIKTVSRLSLSTHAGTRKTMSYACAGWS